VESSQLSDEKLSSHYAWPQDRSFRLNMLLDGKDKSVGSDSTSESLTSPEDRRVLRANRAHADVVIVGAASIRAEGWFLPIRGRLAVLSISSHLPWESCPDKSRVNLYPSVSALMHSLKESEHNILCEGGVTTAELLQTQVGFDEIALTRIGNDSRKELPDFLQTQQDYMLNSTLSDAENGMTFQFWRRAVRPH
jgi:riboflavin biosynthesis pyrimidine reductase